MLVIKSGLDDIPRHTHSITYPNLGLIEQVEHVSYWRETPFALRCPQFVGIQRLDALLQKLQVFL